MKVDMNTKGVPESWTLLNLKRQALQTCFTKRKSVFHARRTQDFRGWAGEEGGATQSMRIQVASGVNPLHRCPVDLATMRKAPVTTCRSMGLNATETETSAHID